MNNRNSMNQTTNSSFDPEAYSIVIRKEKIDGEEIFVARVQEFPDLVDFAESFSEARELILDSITTIYEIAEESNSEFPQPFAPIDEALPSGRITLRLPRSLHNQLVCNAEKEEVSLNHYISTLLAVNSSRLIAEQLLERLEKSISQVQIMMRNASEIQTVSISQEGFSNPTDWFIELGKSASSHLSRSISSVIPVVYESRSTEADVFPNDLLVAASKLEAHNG